jgi:hypothetical protein
MPQALSQRQRCLRVFRVLLQNGLPQRHGVAPLLQLHATMRLL